jgi:hypothetical protein
MPAKKAAAARAEVRGGVAQIVSAAAACLGAEAVLDVAMIDWTGTISAGRLRRGANPVLMTAELVLIPTLPAEVP